MMSIKKKRKLNFLDKIDAHYKKINNCIDANVSYKNRIKVNSCMYEDFQQQKVREFSLLRKQLIKEQKFLCCYCQRRIGEGNAITVRDVNTNGSPLVYVEHWHPKKGINADTCLALTYSNLFGVCDGNRKHKGTSFCEAHKGDKVLQKIQNLSRVSQSHMDDLVKYSIRHNEERVNIIPCNSKDELLVKDLGGWIQDDSDGTNGILNLNHDYLAKARFDTLKSILICIKVRKKGDKIDVSQAKKLLNRYNEFLNDGVGLEFSGFAIWFLKRVIKKGYYE